MEKKWTKINLPYGKIWDKNLNELDSFCKRGLNNPGTIVEVNGKEYLIGHINAYGGICDDCVEFDTNATVKRYKVIASF